MGIAITLEKFSSGLRKTRESLMGKVQKALTGRSVIDENLLETIEEILLLGDVGTAATSAVLEGIKRRVKEERYSSTGELLSLLKDEIDRALQMNGREQMEGFLSNEATRPYVIMVVGVNGAGKTTTIGKLAFRFRQEGYGVLLGAADTFRAAANEQLGIWAERAGVPLVRHEQGADPASVAFDTLSSAMAKQADVVILDTAGRLHTKVNLMEELKKIRRVLEKKMPGAPHETLLVLDATTGQNALVQARQFKESVGVTGIVLTKLDGTAKGGIILAIQRELGIPVRYVGVGEQVDDLQPFDRRSFVEALFA